MNPESLRRIVYIHTAGPYAGLRQILGLSAPEGVLFLHTGELRAHSGPPPDVLAPIAMPPDGRISAGMRLKSTDRYVLYQERLRTPAETQA
jgi:hypothetical protein